MPTTLSVDCMANVVVVVVENVVVLVVVVVVVIVEVAVVARKIAHGPQQTRNIVRFPSM